MNDGYYSVDELKALGLKSFGKNVQISRKASIYAPEKISIGHDVRIDDFCFLVGDITLGSYIHIAPYASIHGTGGGSVKLSDFCVMASHASIYAGSDNYSGEYLLGPMVDHALTKIEVSDIVMEKHSGMCLSSILLPGAYLAEGTVLSAGSVLSARTQPWYIYLGNPARKTLEREKGLLEKEKQFLLGRDAI